MGILNDKGTMKPNTGFARWLLQTALWIAMLEAASQDKFKRYGNISIDPSARRMPLDSGRMRSAMECLAIVVEQLDGSVECMIYNVPYRNKYFVPTPRTHYYHKHPIHEALKVLQWGTMIPDHGIVGMPFNQQSYTGKTRAECRQLCEAATTMMCLSIDTHISNACQLSEYYKDLSGGAFMPYGGYQYQDRVCVE
ncbi:hypothetical protein CAPTEDRAFT_193333 [Capitella teleta]|uniref:Apple domain-containing protein n=1 Tax=Capitella teleta TaxID=283909 RepID=R7V1F7_CAPTE|nr:hypothetical protein CAPTEDRAFT_193333 [Capitella teleta]|eukprot:ELU10037.1 hypothetical protein CAPTEDRAFT_193333 [Capitella teleta]